MATESLFEYLMKNIIFSALQIARINAYGAILDNDSSNLILLSKSDWEVNKEFFIKNIADDITW